MKKLFWSCVTILAVVTVSCGGGGGGGTSAPVTPRQSSSIVITNLPKGAVVYIDSVKKQTSAANTFTVEPGERSVQVKKAGYRMTASAGAIKVIVGTAERKELSVELSAIAPPVLPGAVARN